MDCPCILRLLVLTTSFAVVCGGQSKDKDECCGIAFWESVAADNPSCSRPTKCPKPLGKEWNRLQKLCCSQSDGGKFYHCQQDDEGRIDVLCVTPVSCPQGKYASIKHIFLGLLCQTCPLEQYQPTRNDSYTFVRPKCDKKRIKCEDFDAVPLVTGNSSSDDTCMCDWVNGYRPVSTTSYSCRTFNSSHASTCRCAHSPCPEGQTLHPKSFDCIKIAEADEDYHREFRAYTQQLNHRLDGKTEILRAIQDDEHRMREVGDINRPPIVQHTTYMLLTSPETPQIPKEEGPVEVWDPSHLPWCLTSHWALLILVIGALCVFGAKVLLQLLPFGKGSQKPRDLLIRVSFKSQNTADIFYREVKNVLPMLARHYGHLKLASNSVSRHLTIVLHPKAGRPLHLAHFFRDILSPEAIKHVTSGSKSNPDDIQFYVWSGCFEDASQAHADHTPPPANCSHVSCDTGEIIFKFSGADEQIIKSLRSTSSKAIVSSIFTKHHLDFQDIRSGSIVFRFHLPHGCRTFDTFATDERMRGFAKDLLSHEAFDALAIETSVRVEFFCKTRLAENVSVVYTENLTMQIGMRNNVILCDKDPASHCDHAHALADAANDDDVLVSEADESQTAVGEMLKVNTLRIKTNATATRLGVKDSWVAKNREPNDVFIKVQCYSPTLSQSLQTQWLNIMPLLKNYYPGCQMHYNCKDSTILWRLRAPDGKVPDTPSFLKDIFAIENVKYLAMEASPRIDVFIPNCEEAVQLTVWQRGKKFLKTSMERTPIRLSAVLMAIWLPANLCSNFYVQLVFVTCVLTFLYLQT